MPFCKSNKDGENRMTKDLKMLMKKNKFELEKKTKHYRWRHKVTGVLLRSSSTPTDKNAIRQIQRDIKKLLGAVA